MRFTVFPILAGLILGSGIVFCISSQRFADRPVKVVTVLVARQAIPRLTILNEPEKWFKPVQYVNGDEPRNALTAFDQLKNKMLVNRLVEDQPVRDSDLEEGQPEVIIPRGMRAVALQVDPKEVAGGFIKRQSRVDLLLIIRQGDKAGQTRTVLETVLENLLVLDVQEVYRRFDGDRPLKLDPTVTFLVTPEQTSELAKTQQKGKIKLVLRSVGDKD